MSNKTTPPIDIIKNMVDEMPYFIPKQAYPYIEEAMKIYAKKRNKQIISQLEKEIVFLKATKSAYENKIGELLDRLIVKQDEVIALLEKTK